MDKECAIFAEPLNDNKVPKKLQHQMASWHQLASELGYTGPVTWRVCAGLTLKQHASLAAPCYEQWGYFQNCQFQNDEPTKEELVFWIPRLLTNSARMEVQEQLSLLVRTRERLQLPAQHLRGFGSAALLAPLILGHCKRTGERVPLKDMVYVWARTDTFLVNGARLNLRFDVCGLAWRLWPDSVASDVGVGAFPLGWEPL